MQIAQWRETIGEMVRDHMRSPELEYYFSVKMNKARAQLMITQLGLYIRHRRDCWALVSANCPVMAIKYDGDAVRLGVVNARQELD